MNWLLFNTEFPWPLTHGTYLRVYHLAKALVADGDTVSLLAGSDHPLGRQAYSSAGIQVLPTPSGGQELPRHPCWRLSPYSYRPALAGSLSGAGGQFDAVVLFRAEAMQYADQAATAGAVVAELVDDPVLEHRRRLWRELHPQVTAWRLKFLAFHRHYELNCLPKITLTTFVSDADSQSFQRRHPTATVLTLPNGVEVDRFSRPPDRPAAVGTPSFVFLGNLTHRPNEDAARFLLRGVAPRIQRELPDARFVVVGDNPSPALRALAGERATITGFVAEVQPYLWDATAVLLPMRMGTGIKNKLLEAWAAGAAVVASPLACQGVRAQDGHNLLVARDSGQFASAAVRLAQDPDLRTFLGGQGRQTVLGQHVWSGIARRLRLAVQQALKQWAQKKGIG